MEMMEQNNNYLQWWANSEHGGTSLRDDEGKLRMQTVGDVDFEAARQVVGRGDGLRAAVRVQGPTSSLRPPALISLTFIDRGKATSFRWGSWYTSGVSRTRWCTRCCGIV